MGLMCEYDALPGIGHACGHNLIAEAAVAAALGIKEALQSHVKRHGESVGKVISLIIIHCCRRTNIEFIKSCMLIMYHTLLNSIQQSL